MSPMFFPEESDPNQSPTLTERLRATFGDRFFDRDKCYYAALDLIADHDRLTAALSAAEEKILCTLGVGDGSGQLFVHGDHASIKAAQAIVLERDSLREQLAQADEEVFRLWQYSHHYKPDISKIDRKKVRSEIIAILERHAARKRAEEGNK